MSNATDFTKCFLSSDLHLPAPFPPPDFSAPLPLVGSRPAVAPAPSPVTLAEATGGKCNSLWESRVLTQICFLAGSQDGWGLRLAPALAAAMQDEAGAFSPVANYPFTLLNGNSPALFCQRFINPVAAFLREVRGGKFAPINILYESRRQRLCWVQRGGCGHRGTPAWGWRGAGVLCEPVLKVPGQGCAGCSWSTGAGGTPSLHHHLCFAVWAGWGAAP